MSETRPGPIMKPAASTPMRERLRGWKEKAALAWYRTSIFVVAKKSMRMLSLQLLGSLSVLIGISYYSIPAALIVGGIGAILVAERQ